MFKRVLFTALCLLSAATLAVAHDAWIEKRDGELVVLYGHRERHDPYDPQKIKDPKAYDPKGVAVPVDIVKHKENATLALKGNAAIVSVFFDNGYWVKTTDTTNVWKNLPKREAQKQFTVLDSSKVQKYAKTILASCEASTKPIGLPFEIVPEKDPLTVKPGDILPLKVLLDGKPLEGVVIKTGDSSHSESKQEIKTDKDGKASVPISKPGPQSINVFQKLSLKNDPDADGLSNSASLTFEIK
ncbi:DUF4198 domain-containing protein [Desulfomonile tiedjei]|uniref:ABC-type Co2+ transport system, periplasmic component n=1 Tax=Desulfomonile tiedjei (strain ATCC 49306 / DSM 6799 / DCB-1) TaxID=706587 RepID=I4C1L4_DESTA|nr:DUF4198 domain-containing protein [Desulfomonile tiedjei]AFM23455.1 ABC-type Co2+ transport system, periplasmic component [Desulfomonile tiedjei DSM 6799]